MSKFVKSPDRRFLRVRDLNYGTPVFMFPPGYKRPEESVFQLFEQDQFVRPPTIILLSSSLHSNFAETSTEDDFEILLDYQDTVQAAKNYFLKYELVQNALDLYFDGPDNLPYNVATEDVEAGRAPYLYPNIGRDFIGGRILRLHFMDNFEQSNDSFYDTAVALAAQQKTSFFEEHDKFYYYRCRLVKASPSSPLLGYDFGSSDFSSQYESLYTSFVNEIGTGENFDFSVRTIPFTYEVTPSGGDIPNVVINDMWATITTVIEEERLAFEQDVK